MTIDLARGPSTRGKKDFKKLYSPSTYDQAIARLKERLPSLTDADVVLEIMRIHASAKVAHNTVGIPGTMGFGAGPVGAPHGLGASSEEARLDRG